MPEKKIGAGEPVGIIFLKDRVPGEHLLRKIDSAIDFTHIYDLAQELYCKDNG
ncbi:MAG: hypothetical protein LLF87_09595 [Eubacteriales bacterium]|nr:hypothetical protein [Eubacteriales bacterium]